MAAGAEYFRHNYQIKKYFHTFFTEFTLVTLGTAAVAINTMAMAITVWHLTLVMTDAALATLPSRPAHTLPITVLPLARA